MGTLIEVERRERLVDESIDLEALELCSVAAGLFQEGDPHGYAELNEAIELMHGREPKSGLLASTWSLLRDGGWVGDLQHCWHCGNGSDPSETMAWQAGELICKNCGTGMEISAGVRKGIMAQFGTTNVGMSATDLSCWQKMILDVLKGHGVRSMALFQEKR